MKLLLEKYPMRDPSDHATHRQFMQIILIGEKTKCNIGFGLCLIVSSRCVKVTDLIGFTFVPHCDCFVKTSKFLRESISS